MINEPVLIAGFLTDYFDTAGRIIHNNNGIVDKFIGDGIMALFGFYSDDKTQGALNAVTSALQLRQSFKQYDRNGWKSGLGTLLIIRLTSMLSVE